jgi:hypothetical protein
LRPCDFGLSVIFLGLCENDLLGCFAFVMIRICTVF